jgi:hypothetical protein
MFSLFTSCCRSKLGRPTLLLLCSTNWPPCDVNRLTCSVSRPLCGGNGLPYDVNWCESTAVCCESTFYFMMKKCKNRLLQYIIFKILLKNTIGAIYASRNGLPCDVNWLSCGLKPNERRSKRTEMCGSRECDSRGGTHTVVSLFNLTGISMFNISLF